MRDQPLPVEVLVERIVIHRERLADERVLRCRVIIENEGRNGAARKRRTGLGGEKGEVGGLTRLDQRERRKRLRKAGKEIGCRVIAEKLNGQQFRLRAHDRHAVIERKAIGIEADFEPVEAGRKTALERSRMARFQIDALRIGLFS